jgi:hypothetical protein
MRDRKNMPNACDPLDARIRISTPVSIALHPSGEMDVIFCGSRKDTGSPEKQRIRFSPLAASHFLDAIHAAVKDGRIVFRENQQESFH